MRYICLDIKKLCKNRLVLLAWAILLVAAVIDPITQRRTYAQFGNPFMWWLFMNNGSGSTIFNTLRWVFPVLLTGLIFFDESRTSIYGIILTKKRRAVYVISKAASLFAVTFISCLGLFLLNLTLTYTVCPENTEIAEFLVPKAGTFAASLYRKSPLHEAVVYNVLHALAMALLSVLYLALHMVMKPKHKALALTLPPLVMYLLDYMTQTMAKPYSLTMILQPLAASATTFMFTGKNVITAFGVLVVMDITLLIAGLERNRDVV